MSWKGTLVGVLAFVAGMFGALATSGADAQPGVHVAGNLLLDGQGRQLSLRGVNRSGTEYACIQGFGIFDGPSSAASVQAIASWHVNFVRVPLNEDCWLGINGVKPSLSGASYRKAILKYVAQLHQHGMYAELSLMWGAPGHYRAVGQPHAPDADHSPAMWASMAAAFKNDPNVVLAPWGEPVITPGCLLNGCQTIYQRVHRRYRSAGMQQAVNVMRGAGYRGVIAIPGTMYANDLSHWLAFEPADPRNQLIAEAHVYGKNACSSVSCFDQEYLPVADQVPLIFGETGETFDASSCGSTNISTFLQWADQHQVGYAAWTWDRTQNCFALISDYNGTPAHQYGLFVQSYYGQQAAGTLLLGS